MAGNKVEYLYITSKNKKPDNMENEESSTARKDKESPTKSASPLKRTKSLTKKNRKEMGPPKEK